MADAGNQPRDTADRLPVAKRSGRPESSSPTRGLPGWLLPAAGALLLVGVAIAGGVWWLVAKGEREAEARKAHGEYAEICKEGRWLIDRWSWTKASAEDSRRQMLRESKPDMMKSALELAESAEKNLPLLRTQYETVFLKADLLRSRWEGQWQRLSLTFDRLPSPDGMK